MPADTTHWTLGDLLDAQVERVRTRPPQTLDDLRFAQSFAMSRLAEGEALRLAALLGCGVRTRLPVQMDSQAKHVALARGDIHAVLRFPPAAGHSDWLWDALPAMHLVEEAGGVVTHMDGRPVTCRHGATLGNASGLLFASDAKTHQLLAAALAAMKGRAGDAVMWGSDCRDGQ
eukprot:Selendium_serpulae@DN2507_c0_g1_i8.p2